MAIASASVNEIKLLLRSLRPAIFRLIVVQYNHRQVVDQVVEQIQYTYADRRFLRTSVKHKSYRALMETIYQQDSGVLIIEDFQYILRDPEVYVAFNQRRDKIAQYPLALVCFVPTGNEVLQECMKKLPDLWSFRNLIVEILWKSDTSEAEPEEHVTASTLGGKTVREKEKELNRLVNRVAQLQGDANNTALLLTYYPQISQLLAELGAYHRGLEYVKQWINLIRENSYEKSLPDSYADALNWKARFSKYRGS